MKDQLTKNGIGKGQKKRNIKKISEGTAYAMLRNQAMFASERPSLNPKKKKIGQKNASKSRVKKKKLSFATTARGKCKSVDFVRRFNLKRGQGRQ